MAERLNNIAYAEYMTANHQESLGSNFNPRSVSFDVRTPEELAAVNEFLVTLGRDVASGGTHRQPLSSDGLPYFDAASLSQLGLWGMPGVPTSGPGFPSEQMYTSGPGIDSLPAPLHSMARSTHPSAQPSLYGNIYSSGNDPGASFSPADFSFQRRHSSKFPSMSNVSGSFSSHHHRPTPPLDTGSPHSSVSSPANSTPPHNSLLGSDTSSFDYLRASRGEAPAPQLVPVDYMEKSRRTILPLKTAPGDPPEPVEPKLTHGIHRGPPAKLIPSAVSSLSSSKSSLYPLLTSGDVQYKLPPLKDMYSPSSPVAVSPSSPGSTPKEHDTTLSSRSTSDQPKYNLPPLSHMYRSPSPVGSPQSQSSRSSTPSSTLGSPVTQPCVLPSLRSITTLGGGRPSESDELSQKIGRIELENRTKEISHEERKHHSELILNLLIQINKDFKLKYGTPSPVTVKPANRKLLFSDCPRDVEMALG
jgi:hypothetical protein